MKNELVMDQLISIHKPKNSEKGLPQTNEKGSLWVKLNVRRSFRIVSEKGQINKSKQIYKKRSITNGPTYISKRGFKSKERF